MHDFCLVGISTLEVYEISLLVKLQESAKLWQTLTRQVYVPPFWLCFLNFILVDQAEISHMNRQKNLSW